MFNFKTMLRTGVAIVFLVAIASLLSYNVGVRAQNVTTSTAPARNYYLTKSTITGSNVLTACASGYHFASIWEMLNTSDLHYNTTLGRKNVNSGQGAPALTGTNTLANAPFGWIRTGGTADPNCINWTSSNGTDTGSSGVLLVPGGSQAPAWEIDNGTSGGTALSCNGTLSGTQTVTVGVWCVEN